jgi:hypothetical protein
MMATPPRVDEHAFREALERQNAHSDALEAALKRIDEHPFKARYQENESLRITITDVFLLNALELCQHLRKPAQDPQLALELANTNERTSQAEVYGAELVRLIHNYTASAYSLREHIKRINNLRRKRFGPAPDALKAEFDRRISILDQVPEVGVVNELRTFLQHFAQVPLAHRLRVVRPNTPEAMMDTEIRVSSRELLDLKKLTASARTFLESDASFALLPVVETHVNHVLELYRWYYNELVSDSANLLNGFNELQAEYNAILSGQTVDEARAAMAADAERDRLRDAAPPS